MLEAQQAVPSKSESDERKLWLDYVKTLNERRLQANQRSGLTTYVLLAVLVALVVKYLPKAPAFLTIEGNSKTTLTVFLFEADSVLYLYSAIFLVYYYVHQGLESRIAPESESRMTQTMHWVFSGIITALVLLHFGVAANHTGFVRRACIGVGLFLSANLLFSTWSTVQRIRKARKNKVPVPPFRFRAYSQGSLCLLVSGIFLMPSVFAAYSLFRVLSATGNWLPPLRAATIGISCVTLAIVLSGRSLISSSQATYDALERDIVLMNLSPGEIKARFEKQILGRNVADWLGELLKALEIADQDLKNVCESVSQKTREILQIDASYVDERAARATKVRKEFVTGLDHYRTEREKFDFQVESFLSDYSDDRGIEIVKRWVEEYKRTVEKNKATLDACKGLAEQLSPLIPEKK